MCNQIAGRGNDDGETVNGTHGRGSSGNRDGADGLRDLCVPGDRLERTRCRLTRLRLADCRAGSSLAPMPGAPLLSDFASPSWSNLEVPSEPFDEPLSTQEATPPICTVRGR